MSAATLVANLQARGVWLKVEGERLLYDAPRGVMKPSDLEELRTHKVELVNYLNKEAANSLSDPTGLAHVLNADKDSGDRYLVSPGTAALVSLMCRLRPPY